MLLCFTYNNELVRGSFSVQNSFLCPRSLSCIMASKDRADITFSLQLNTEDLIEWLGIRLSENGITLRGELNQTLKGTDCNTCNRLKSWAKIALGSLYKRNPSLKLACLKNPKYSDLRRRIKLRM